MKTIPARPFLAFIFSIALATAAWAQPLTVTTIAGHFDDNAYSNGVGTNASFRDLNDFSDLAADGNGFLYVVDGNTIRRISPEFLVVTLAGNPNKAGYVDASGTNALFSSPAGIAADANGNVYVADQGNYVIRKITPAGLVSTVAGDGNYGYVDSAAGTPEFQGPNSVALDGAGNIYVADYTTLRKITPAGVVSTLAGTQTPGFDDGTGTDAQFNSPFFLAANAAGNIYVAMGSVIRVVTPDGVASTLAGSEYTHNDADGIGTNAGFNGAYSIALDTAGGLYVADGGGVGGTIRYVTSGGVVTTVAGVAGQYPKGGAGFPGQGPEGSNNGVGSTALFGQPLGIAVDTFDNVYIVDGFFYTVSMGVPPALSTVGSVSESAGIAPVRSNNPWQFTAYYTNIVSDLRLRVQSTQTTNDEGSWADLPGSTDMTDLGGNWTLNATYVPGGTQWFRVIAAAPGYQDGVSAAVGPENVLQGIAPFGSFTWQTTTPYRSGAAWTFTIVETPVVAGMNLRVQSGDGSGWTDLAGGQMATSDGTNWTLTTEPVPTGTNSFRVVASAPTYPDQISGPVGPFTIVAGLPDTGTFLLTTGGTPTRSSNPWQFLVIYTNQVAGLQLRVQSTETTNEDGSWEDLPENPYMTNDAGAWTLFCTDVPTGDQYFRVVASASGCLDGFSTISEPQTVLPGFNPWGLPIVATTRPYSTPTPWTFTIVQPAVVPGMSVKMQLSATPGDPTSWTNLPGGAEMTLYSDEQTWVLYTTSLPTGNIAFRAVASAPDYVDLASGWVGPFPITPPLPVSPTTLSQGGTYSVQDFAGFVNAINTVIHVIGVAVHLIPNGNATTQGAVTMYADQGWSVDLTVPQGQSLTAKQLGVGTRANLIVTGPVNADLDVGVVSNDGGSIIGLNGHGLLTQDGGGLVAKNGASAATIGVAALLEGTHSPIIAHDSSGVLSQNGSAVLSQNGSAVVSQNGSAVVGLKGSAGVGRNVGESPSSPKPFPAKPNTPIPNTPPTQPSFTGVMTVNGNYTQLAGALLIAIAGTNTASDGAQQYDQLAVSGQANFFGGCIAFGLFDPDDQTDQTNVFQPPDGATFDVVVASNIVTQGLSVRGPLWGDGQFINWSVVTRPDGLQALRLTAVEIPPTLFAQSAGSLLQLAYATNYTGYSLQSSPDLSNWTTLSTGTNVVLVSPTNAYGFFRLSQP